MTIYDQYWKKNRRSYGTTFVDRVCELLKFDSVLDAGCGKGDCVRMFLNNGKRARGVDISKRALKYCPQFEAAGVVQQSDLANLPFDDRSFDLVYCSDVLEHIEEDQIPLVINELVRVAKDRLFLTISLRPSSENNRWHPTIKSRDWWETQFEETGVVTNREIVRQFQSVMPFWSNARVLARGRRKLPPFLLEFLESTEIEYNGELEPWFFVFDK